MFSLPKSSEYNKVLPKKYILESLELNTSDKRIIENEISKLSIVNMIDAERINLFNTKDSFPLVIIYVQTKTSEYNPKVSEALLKAINQKIILFFSFNSGSFFTTKRSSLILTSKSLPSNEWNFRLSGTSMHEVWDNLIIDIFSIIKYQNKTLDESIQLKTELLRLETAINKLEDKARREVQPRRKRMLVEEIIKLKNELKEKSIYD